MTYKVRFSYSNKAQEHKLTSFLRIGTEIYRHPENRFIVLEFSGLGGKFRESFRLEELMGVEA